MWKNAWGEKLHTANCLARARADYIFKSHLLLTGIESEMYCLQSFFPEHCFESNYMADNTNGHLTSLTYLFSLSPCYSLHHAYPRSVCTCAVV